MMRESGEGRGQTEAMEESEELQGPGCSGGAVNRFFSCCFYLFTKPKPLTVADAFFNQYSRGVWV